jgi:hypothetical protein
MPEPKRPPVRPKPPPGGPAPPSARGQSSTPSFSFGRDDEVGPGPSARLEHGLNRFIRSLFLLLPLTFLLIAWIHGARLAETFYLCLVGFLLAAMVNKGMR